MMHDGQKSPPYPPSDFHGSQSSHPPPSHHTTVTMTTNTHPGNPNVTEINLNIGYFKTLPGILKLIQLIFGIICMATASPARGYIYRTVDANRRIRLSGNSYGTGHNHWFLFVVVTAFIITLLWCFFYLLQIKDSIKVQMPFSWLRLEYFYTVVTTILYVIAFIVILAGFGHCAGYSYICDARVAAGSFGIFNTIAYGLGAYILHNDYKATPPELQ